MSIRFSLILLTVVSVVADTLLLPFYPQFFAQSFGMESETHVGYYIAACCFTVMVSFPVWAKVARYIHELHLWVYTQIVAGLLGLACYYTESLVNFWLLSQTMLVFKASYLLIYPYAIRLEEKDKHLGLVGLFSVLMHIGGIGGALLGGLTLQVFDARDVYLLMPAGDALQVVVCIYLIARFRVPRRPQAHHPSSPGAADSKPSPLVLRLGLISLLFYFSAFLIRPFFARYWNAVSGIDSELLAGAVYAIPALVALIGLWFNTQAHARGRNEQRVLGAFCLGMAGLILQGAESSWLVIAGRCLYGWAMFQATVRLEVMLFESSDPAHYGDDFSKIHFCQNVGVLLSSFTVGALAANFDLQMTFVVACIGFACTALLFHGLFLTKLRPAKPAASAIEG